MMDAQNGAWEEGLACDNVPCVVCSSVTSSNIREEDLEPEPSEEGSDSTSPPHSNNASGLHLLFEEMLGELHGQAGLAMGGDANGHTLQPTALVNEAFMRMQGSSNNDWDNRDHFLKTAARIMRHVLIDHHRKKTTQKRCGQRSLIELDNIAKEFEEHSIDCIALDAALDELAKQQPQMAEAIQLQFFAGATISEIARILDIPLRTLERRLLTVRSWLRLQLK